MCVAPCDHRAHRVSFFYPSQWEKVQGRQKKNSSRNKWKTAKRHCWFRSFEVLCPEALRVFARPHYFSRSTLSKSNFKLESIQRRGCASRTCTRRTESSVSTKGLSPR